MPQRRTSTPSGRLSASRASCRSAPPFGNYAEHEDSHAGLASSSPGSNSAAYCAHTGVGTVRARDVAAQHRADFAARVLVCHQARQHLGHPSKVAAGAAAELAAAEKAVGIHRRETQGL